MNFIQQVEKPTEQDLKIAEQVATILDLYDLELDYLGTRPKRR